MPKHLQARQAQDEQEERQVRRLDGSHHAPADWKFHAQMVVESWAGKTPQEIATTLSCHPRTVRIHLNRFNLEGIDGLAGRPSTPPACLHSQRGVLAQSARRLVAPLPS